MQASKLNAYAEYHFLESINISCYSIRIKNVKLLVISETESSDIEGAWGVEHPATLGPHPSK